MPIDPLAIDDFLRRAKAPLILPRAMQGHELDHSIQSAFGVAYRPKTPPRYWQHQSLAFLCSVKSGLLFLSPRLGKTKITLDYLTILKAAGLLRQQALVVSPSPIIMSVWEHEATLHSNLSVHVTRNGPDGFLEAIESGKDVVVVSWSTLQTAFTYKALNRKRQSVLKADVDALTKASKLFDAIIFDEIHTAKNPASLRFEMAAPLVSQIRYRVGLTGTPFGRNPFDLWSQTFLIDGGRALSSNFYFFREAFGIEHKKFFGRMLRELVFDKRKLPLIKKKMAAVSFSYDFNEVKRVEVIAGQVTLKMYGDQKEHYNSLIDDYVLEHNGNAIPADAIFTRLRQISSGFRVYRDDDGQDHTLFFNANPKLEWLAEFAADVKDEFSIVVFHDYLHTGALLARMLEKARIKHVAINGAVTDRVTPLRAFQAGEVKWLVINNQVGNAGIDLACAHHHIFFESPVSAIIRAQAEKRAQGERGGRPLFLDDIVCSPVEHRIRAMTKQGIDMLKAVITPNDLRSLKG